MNAKLPKLISTLKSVGADGRLEANFTMLARFKDERLKVQSAYVKAMDAATTPDEAKEIYQFTRNQVSDMQPAAKGAIYSDAEDAKNELLAALENILDAKLSTLDRTSKFETASAELQQTLAAPDRAGPSVTAAARPMDSGLASQAKLNPEGRPAEAVRSGAERRNTVGLGWDET